MTSQAAVGPRWHLWLRVAATVAAWLVVMAGIHHLTIAYHAELTRFLNSPAHQIAATSLLLTALAYLVVMSLPALPRLTLRSLVIVAAWALLLALALYVSRIGVREAQAVLVTLRGEVGVLALALLALAYAIALAMPFVPGMELGLLIMVAFGTAGVLVAYAATIIGLALAYTAGQVLPARFMRAHLAAVEPALAGHDMASAMPEIISTRWLGRNAPPKLLAHLLAHRYLALAIFLNLPANAVVGGGGGVAFLCGMSGRFGWRAYLLTIAIATSPVPILMLTGLLSLDPAVAPYDFSPAAWTWLERLSNRAR